MAHRRLAGEAHTDGPALGGGGAGDVGGDGGPQRRRSEPGLPPGVMQHADVVDTELRMGGDEATVDADFAVVLFAGMLIHGLFAECVNRAPSLVLSNPNFVKKVVFPLEVLPWAAKVCAKVAGSRWR